MEVFIEEDQVFPVRVSDVVTIMAMGWTPTGAVWQEEGIYSGGIEVTFSQLM